MPVQVRTLPAYSDTRNGLVEALGLAETKMSEADASEDPNSPFQQALAASNAALDQLRALAVNALKQIDEAVAGSDLVRDIGRQAASAKREADRIANAAHTIEQIAGVINTISGVVTQIGGLPFL
jgi:methyl-accepting chemotaxis protein